MTANVHVRPGYKQTDVGVIPEDWQRVTVADLAARKPNAIVGGPFGSDLVSNDYVPYGVPVIRGQNMGGHSVSGDFAFVSPEKAKSLKANTAAPLDIVFTQRGTLGQVSVVPARGFATYVVSQSQMKLTPDLQRYDPEYLLQFFVSNPGQQQILESAIQTGVPHTNLGILKAYKLPAPPLSEQRAIAAALSDADALIASLDALIAKKRNLKQATMQQLLTGKTRLPAFKGKWTTKRLGEVGPLQRGFDLPTKRLRSGQYPVVYSNGILNFHDKYQVRGPGIVTGRSGTIGNVTFVKEDYWPHNTALWVTSFRGNDPKFVFYLYSSLGFERFATGSGVPTLNRNDVHAFGIKLPVESAEQAAIAAILSDIDADLLALAAKRDKSRALKQAMMQELLTGRTRLT